MKQIERLRSLMEKATAGEWHYGAIGGYIYREPAPLVKYVIAVMETSDEDTGPLIVEAVNALPDLLSHIDALEARVEELQAAINTMAEKVSECAERYTVAERALAEAVEVLRAIDGHVSHGRMGGWSIALNEIRKLARAFLTKRGEKSNA